MIIHKQNKTKWFNRGFTLIELLVVVSIIGMLSSVVLVSVQGARNKAKDAKLILEVKELQKALELYRLDNGKYPGNVAGEHYYHGTRNNCIGNPGDGGAQNGHTLTEAGMFDNTFTSKYMPTLPTELVSCGIYYIAFSNSAEESSINCIDGNNVTVQPDGYNGNNNKIAGTNANAYLILIKPLTNISTVSFPVIAWPVNPDPSTRCVLGPVM